MTPTKTTPAPVDPAFEEARKAYDKAILMGLHSNEAFSIATEVYTAAKRKLATR